MAMWDEWRAQALSEAERIFNEDVDANRVAAVIAEWLEEARPLRPADDRDIQLSAETIARELHARLIGCGLEAWAGRLALLAEGAGAGPATIPEYILAELALGAGLGRLCGRTPERALFELNEALSRTRHDARRGFSAGADAGLRETPDAQAALAAFLRTQVDDFTAAPRRMAWASGANTCAMVESFRRSPRLTDAWEGPRVRGVFRLRWPEAFDLLRRHDARLYLEIIEAFPHPEPVKQVLDGAGLDADPAALAQLLALAPSAFDEHGTWLTSAKTPFLLLGIADHAIREAALKADGPDAALSRAVAIAEPVIEALLARLDAVHLGHVWAERLISQGSRPHVLRADGIPCEIVPVLAGVLDRLLARLPPLDDPMAWLMRGEEMWRRERALALAAAMLARSENGHDCAADFLALVAERASLWTTYAERALSEYIMETAIAGMIVAGLQDPAGWFDHSWRRLASVRDRARHSIPDRIGNGHGGHLLLVWAACGLQRLPPGSAQAKALWISLECAVRVTRITEWRANSASVVLSCLHRYLAAFWPHTFPEDPPATEPGSLDAFLRPFARPDNTLAELVLIAWRHGVSPARLARAAPPSPGLRLLLSAVAEDRTLLRRSAWAAGYRMDEGFDERLHALIQELGSSTAT